MDNAITFTICAIMGIVPWGIILQGSGGLFVQLIGLIGLVLLVASC